MTVTYEEIKTITVISLRGTLRFSVNYAIAPVGEKVFVILGVDRIRYTPIDSEFGKEVAVRVVKKIAWNVKLVKVGRNCSKKVSYTIPKRFAKILGISKGDIIMVALSEDFIDLFPEKNAKKLIGVPFKEPIPQIN